MDGWGNRMNDNMMDRDTLMLQVADLYYQQNLNQKEIAKLFNISRPTVSRLLEEARQKKLVEIIIHRPLPVCAELAQAVKEMLGLKYCIVVENATDYKATLERCAQATMDFFYTILDNNMTVAIAWGYPVRCFIEKLESRSYYNVHIAQMVGCLSTGDPTTDGIEYAAKFAEKVNGSFTNIYAPVFVKNKIVKDYFEKEPPILNAINRASKADIAIMGVGLVDDKNSSLTKTGNITEEEWAYYRQKGGVAHLLARIFDSEGKEIQHPDKYTIAAPLAMLKNVNWSIGIAVSPEKDEAIRAAVKAGYINTLVMDRSLGEKLLEAGGSGGHQRK